MVPLLLQEASPLSAIKDAQKAAWLSSALENEDGIEVRDTAQLSGDADILQRLLETHGYDSFAAIPIRIHEELWGYLGFVPASDSRLWVRGTTPMLRIVGEMIVNALKRKATRLPHVVRICGTTPTPVPVEL